MLICTPGQKILVQPFLFRGFAKTEMEFMLRILRLALGFQAANLIQAFNALPVESFNPLICYPFLPARRLQPTRRSSLRSASGMTN
jgi:hypothetical protein